MLILVFKNVDDGSGAIDVYELGAAFKLLGEAQVNENRYNCSFEPDLSLKRD
jgi:hypothetical protein